MMAIGVFFRGVRVCFGLFLVAALTSLSFAEDTLTMKNGNVLAGKIVSVADGAVTFQSTASNGSKVTLPYQISDIKSVKMDPPPEFLAVKGQPPAQQVAALAPLVKAYAGLPTDWVLDAMAQLADAYTATNQGAQAAAIYAQINQLYPGSAYTLIATAGQANLLLTQGKPDAALAAVQPVIDAANKTMAPSASDARAYANAFWFTGRCSRRKRNIPRRSRPT